MGVRTEQVPVHVTVKKYVKDYVPQPPEAGGEPTGGPPSGWFVNWRLTVAVSRRRLNSRGTIGL